MKLKRFIAACVFVCLVISIIPPLQTDAAATSGTCGTNAVWSLSGGTLTISGSGEMETFSIYSAPWYGQNITRVVIGSGITNISNYAFHDSSTITSVSIGSSVTSIGICAFIGCTKLTSISIPASVTTINTAAFKGCTGLTSVSLGSGLKTIGQTAFYNTGLTALVIPDNVQTIGYQAFSGCKSMTRLIIGDGVTTISDSAFGANTSLKTVAVGKSVSSVMNSFGYCQAIETVCYNGTQSQWQQLVYDNTFTSIDTATVYYGHSYKTTTTAATCTKAGSIKKVCSICSDSETQVLPATGHSYTSVVTAPACTKQGYTTYTCACGDSYVANYVDATGHTWGDWEQTQTPTCTDEGAEIRRCSCGETQTQALPAAGHSYEAVVTAPTCTGQGYTTYTCACGDSYVANYVEATGHTWGDWEQIQAPTCTDEGAEIRSCSCGETQTQALPAAGHSYEAVVTAPTCTEQGYTTYTCACGDSYVADQVEATGHSYENYVCTHCGSIDKEAPAVVMDLNGDGKVTAFDAQSLAEAKAGLRTLTDEQWEAIGTLTVADIVDYILGRYPAAE